MPPEETEVFEDYKIQENALDIIDVLEAEILKLMLKYAGEHAQANDVKIIDPEQMKGILKKVLEQVLHDERFSRE